MNASFSRRISRPGYSTLNSATRYTDPYTAIQGNLYLQPSVSQSYVLNYTYKSFQVLSLSYLKVNDPVSFVLNQNDQTKESISTYQNLGNTSTLSATSAGSFNIVKWWNVSAEVDAAYNRVRKEECRNVVVKGDINSIFKPELIIPAFCVRSYVLVIVNNIKVSAIKVNQF